MLSRNNKLPASVATVALGIVATVVSARETPASWHDGPAKQTIVAFAEEGSPDFVLPNESVDD